MDVHVLGGGLIGGAIAWRLAQRGFTVRITDAGSFCGESSWAGAGMLSPHGEHFPSDEWKARAVASLGSYPAFVRELERESGVSIDYSAPGAIEGDKVYPDEAIVDPQDVGWALRTALERRDVELVEYTRVDAIDSSDGSARAWVVAAGAWSSQILVDGQRLPESFPVKGHLLGYDCLPGSLGATRRDGHTYVLQRASGFTIAGSNEEPHKFDRAVSEGLVAELRARAEALWPPLAGLEPSRVWTGLRPATASGHPHVERWREDKPVWLAYGHYRNGILLAPWTADFLGSAISESIRS